MPDSSTGALQSGLSSSRTASIPATRSENPRCAITHTAARSCYIDHSAGPAGRGGKGSRGAQHPLASPFVHTKGRLAHHHHDLFPRGGLPRREPLMPAPMSESGSSRAAGFRREAPALSSAAVAGIWRLDWSCSDLMCPGWSTSRSMRLLSCDALRWSWFRALAWSLVRARGRSVSR